MDDIPKITDARQNSGAPGDPHANERAALSRWLLEANGSGPGNVRERNASALNTTDSINCVRCHPEEPRPLPPIDFKIFLADSGRKPLTPEEVAAREESRFRSENSFEKTIHVLSRLPGDLDLKLNGQKASLRTDFASLIESVPTMHLSDTSRQLLGSVKQIDLNADRVTLDLKKQVDIPMNKTEPIIGRIVDLKIGTISQQLSFDVEFDKSGHSVKLKEIQGVAFGLADGKEAAVRELVIDASGPSPTITVNFDNPKHCPEFMKKVWPRTICASRPMDEVLPGLSGELTRSTIGAALQLKDAITHRDASSSLSVVQNVEMREKLQSILSSLQGVSKCGDRLEIERSGKPSTQTLGAGAELTIDNKIAFKIANKTDGTTITSIDGISLIAPIPSQLGLGEKLKTNLREFSARQDSNSGLTIEARTDNLFDKVRLTVGSDFRPQKDRDGNWRVDSVITNPFVKDHSAHLDLSLRFDSAGRLMNKTSDLMDFASRASWQATNASPRGALMMTNTALSGIASEALWIIGK